MSRNPRSQGRPAIASRRPDTCGQVADRQWEQMVLELLASDDSCPPGPGKLDEAAIAQYLSGGCSSEDRAEIERAMARSPELVECVALAREALVKRDAAA